MFLNINKERKIHLRLPMILEKIVFWNFIFFSYIFIANLSFLYLSHNIFLLLLILILGGSKLDLLNSSYCYCFCYCYNFEILLSYKNFLTSWGFENWDAWLVLWCFYGSYSPSYWYSVYILFGFLVVWFNWIFELIFLSK